MSSTSCGSLSCGSLSCGSLNSTNSGDIFEFTEDKYFVQNKISQELCSVKLKEKLSSLIDGLNKLPRSAPPQLNKKTIDYYSSWRNGFYDRTQELTSELEYIDLNSFTDQIKDEFSVQKIVQSSQIGTKQIKVKKARKLVAYIHSTPQVQALMEFVTNVKQERLKIEADLICRSLYKDFVSLNWEPRKIWCGKSPFSGELTLNPRYIARFALSNVQRSLCPDGDLIPKNISVNMSEIPFEKKKYTVDDVLRRIAIYTDFYNNDYESLFDVWKSKSTYIDSGASPHLSIPVQGFEDWTKAQVKTTCAILGNVEESEKNDVEIKLSQYWHIKKLCEFFPVLNIFAEMTINAGGEKITRCLEVLPEIFTNKYDDGKEFCFKKVEGSTRLSIDFNPDLINLEQNLGKDYTVSQIEEFDIVVHPTKDPFEKIPVIARITLAWRTKMTLPSKDGIAAREHVLEILNVGIIPGSHFEKVARFIDMFFT